MNILKNILIVRTDRIGDVILSLPLAWILKKHIPNVKVSFLVRDYTAPLVKNCKYVDEVIVLSEKNGKVQIAENVKALKHKFDVCIAAFPTFRSALVLFLSGIKTRIGSGYRWYSFLFNKKVYEHRKYGERHELEFNVRMLQKLNIIEEVNTTNVDFGIVVDNSVTEFVLNKLRSLGWDGNQKIVVVHPGSGGSAIDLPKEKLKELIECLAANENVVLVITGSASETELCNYFTVSKKVINSAGMFNLEELTAMIKNAEIVIANSTGPIHLAAGLRKNIIGFYPKFAAVSPKRWGPYSANAKIFQPTVCDGKCSRDKCNKLNCMQSIEIEKVLVALDEILQRN
ncbi:MAG: glycosyl transferase family 9 [Ignavibacteria bacterium]|nr:MAG: glycosyl transferase family 9 [Ignavibacteria bacterium]KAF0159300.1 MAG: glycosyl transferase family 9 [Ignavibacteria bacterium]